MPFILDNCFAVLGDPPGTPLTLRALHYRQILLKSLFKIVEGALYRWFCQALSRQESKAGKDNAKYCYEHLETRILECVRV